jgi:hypothetical protein
MQDIDQRVEVEVNPIMEVTLMDMEEGVLCLRLQEHQIPT